MFRFPWGDMHSLNLGWFLQKFNELRADWATAEENITGALDAEIQRAEDALSDVFDARDAAAASATAAAGSASAAGTSATAAQNSATAAASSATLANQKATAAGLSEAAAAQSANAASNSATAAAGSATQAGQSATNAAASETAAGQSATAAAGSASAAATSETNAAASAAAAEAVEQSIPADYTTLSNNVTQIQTDLKNFPLFPYYKELAENFSIIQNSRKITINKNRITVENTGGTSGTYVWVSLFNNGKFLGSAGTLPTALLTLDDTVPFENDDTDNFAKDIKLRRWVKNIYSNDNSAIFAFTIDANNNVSSAGVLYDGKSQFRETSITQVVPAIKTNKNFGLVLLSRYANDNTTEFWIE